jgi:probable rRNA maturation factor
LSSSIQVNYVGDKSYLNQTKVELVAKEVLQNYWKLAEKLPSRCTLDINVVSDNKIKNINRDYLNRNRTTDVIAFSLMEGEGIPGESVPLLGQIVISRDAARRQAKQFGHPVKEEMTILLIHGLLHIAGWEEGKDIDRCQKKIRKILQTAGL